MGDPYGGRYFRILPQQGRNAAGGACGYVINGRMIAGLAMAAYPACYGESGAMAFIVNHHGVVYERDLGPNTATLAPGIKAFDPGKGRSVVKPERFLASPPLNETEPPMRLSLVVAAVVSTFALVQPASAQTSNAAVASAPGKVGVAQTAQVSATITAIDKATRGITLKGPKGDEVKVVAGPEVRNFDQLKVGDVVQLKFLESLVLELKKGGGLKVEKTETVGGARSKPGETPGGAVGRQVTVVGDVIKLDAATQTITVKGPERTVELKARDPEQFKLVAVGDQIQATFTEALAVAVTPVAKPADKAAPKKEKKGGC